MRSIRATIAIAIALLVTAAAAQGLPRDVRLAILEAVVQVIPYDPATDNLAPWSGSGTIISPSGYIVTNYHVIGELDVRRHFEWHAIFMTDPAFTDQPPEFWFWARYIAGDPTHDLALLKIEQWYDEEPVEPGFVFPHVTVGDSNRLIPGDVITIVGYPGISGSTVTFTAGLMSGWVGEDFESGGKQWIKTDAKISHGNSGGGAFDENGYLIGVPTAGRTVKYDELDLEEQAYVRPVSLAWAMIGPHVQDVARAPTGPTSPPATTTTTTPPVTTPPASTPAVTTPPATGAVTTTPTPSGVGTCDACTIGTVTLGVNASNQIGGRGTDYINFHTYMVEVPPGKETLIIELSSDSDLDIAVKYGSHITDLADGGDWEYRDYSEAPGGKFEIALPTPGTWYIDVLYLYPTGSGSYTLSVR